MRKLRCDQPYGSVHRVGRLGVVVDVEVVGGSDGDLVLQKKDGFMLVFRALLDSSWLNSY